MSKNKNRKTKTELGYSAKEIIIPMLILLVFAVLIGVTIVNGLLPQLKNSETDMNYSSEDLIWEQAFLEAEKNKVGVVFEPINTTEDEYTKIRIKCNEFLEQNDEGRQIDANIAVDTVVDEQQFIDGDISKSKASDEKNDNMSETGPIYFQDMLMIRYINTDGKLKVITGMFNGDKSDIVVSRQDKLVQSVEKISKASENYLVSNDTENKADENEAQHPDWISESDYLLGVSETLKSMLLANTTEEIREAESSAMNYFTLEGKQTVFGNRKDIKLSSGSTIETSYIIAGKSDSSKTYKDRIYIQLKIKVGEDEFNTYIILKLNNNLRIYDIDII